MTQSADSRKTYRVFISVAEPSADAHCAGLINALKSKGYDNIEFVGIGGPRMRAAGCKLIEPAIGEAEMLYNAFAKVGHYYFLFRRLKRYLANMKVDLVVVCDSPSFNWHIAKLAKKTGIPTLFYVAPQLWAWAEWRIRKMRRCCDKLCCLLPFEEQWFTSRGIDTTYVGNPMVDRLDIDWDITRDYADFDASKAEIALMPGSRGAEVKSLWVPMQQIALRLKAKYPDARFTTVAVDRERQAALQGAQIEGFECEYTVGSVFKTCREADFAICTSGSATLEVAAAACPMVIMYQSSPILWHLVGKHIINTKYLSLVNILADDEMVPEFMPYFRSIEPIIETVEERLDNRAELTRISRELKNLIRPLAEKKASQETAKTVIQMLGTCTR